MMNSAVQSKHELLERHGIDRVLEAAVAVRGELAGGDESVLALLDDPRVVRRLLGDAREHAVSERFAAWLAGAPGARAADAQGGKAALGESRRPSPRGRRENARVYLCAWPPSDSPQVQELTRATVDPSDRAHDLRDAQGLLVSASQLGAQARPRRYPESQLNVRGLAVDSQFDELYERQRRLDRELGGVPGLSYSRGGAALGHRSGQVGRAAAKLGHEGLRSLLRRNRAAWGEEEVTAGEMAAWARASEDRRASGSEDRP